MSWGSDKGYSAAGAQQSLLDYFKMYFLKCYDIFLITNLMNFFKKGY